VSVAASLLKSSSSVRTRRWKGQLPTMTPSLCPDISFHGKPYGRP
jgi:hypothetical protein